MRRSLGWSPPRVASRSGRGPSRARPSAARRGVRRALARCRAAAAGLPRARRRERRGGCGPRPTGRHCAGCARRARRPRGRAPCARSGTARTSRCRGSTWSGRGWPSGRPCRCADGSRSGGARGRRCPPRRAGPRRPGSAAGHQLVHPVEDPQERRLAAAGRPDQGRDLAGGHGQRDVVEHLVVAEPCTDAVGDQRRGSPGGRAAGVTGQGQGVVLGVVEERHVGLHRVLGRSRARFSKTIQRTASRTGVAPIQSQRRCAIRRAVHVTRTVARSRSCDHSRSATRCDADAVTRLVGRRSGRTGAGREGLARRAVRRPSACGRGCTRGRRSPASAGTVRRAPVVAAASLVRTRSTT